MSPPIFYLIKNIATKMADSKGEGWISCGREECYYFLAPPPPTFFKIFPCIKMLLYLVYCSNFLCTSCSWFGKTRYFQFFHAAFSRS